MLAYEALYHVRCGLWDYAGLDGIIYGVDHNNFAWARYDICKSRKISKIETALSVNHNGAFYPYRHQKEYHLPHDASARTSAFYHRQHFDEPYKDVVLMWIKRKNINSRAYVLIERRMYDYNVLDVWFDPKEADLLPVWRKGQSNGLVSKLVWDGLDVKWYE